MKYSIKDFYYKICEIVRLKKESNLRLDQIEEKLTVHVREPDQDRHIASDVPVESILPEEDLKEWMGKQEMMDYLKISESSYYRWRKSGKLKPIDGFGQDRYLKEDIIALLGPR